MAKKGIEISNRGGGRVEEFIDGCGRQMITHYAPRWFCRSWRESRGERVRDWDVRQVEDVVFVGCQFGGRKRVSQDGDRIFGN